MFPFKLSEIPFSMAGSFLKVRLDNGSDFQRLQICTVRKNAVTLKGADAWAHDLFQIRLYDGERELPYTVAYEPCSLTAVTDKGTLTLTSADPDTVLFESTGPSVHLVPYKAFSWQYWAASNQFRVFDYAARCIHQVRCGANSTLRAFESLCVSGAKGKFKDKPFTMVLDGAQSPRGALKVVPVEAAWEEPLPTTVETIEARRSELQKWMERMPRVSERYAQAAEAAWFLLWHCQVPVADGYTRPAILMSKNWMNQVWAWDNCFNAMAVAHADPKLAWAQLQLLFDHQAANGMLPDHVNDDESRYGFMKPPIYGWTVRRLVDILGLEICRPYIKELYEPICRLTNWWYTFRDSDNDGMCQYHHGNDSGWDNATVFDQGYPTEGTDLAAHLVIQTEALSWMAELLGRLEDAAQWKQRSEQQMKDLLGQGVKDGRFFSPRNGKNEAPECHSLLNCIPMVLGHRLPEDIRVNLVADLSPGGPFLTDYGPATESPRSPKYEPDGYWRGPIWAPSTHLIFDGLVDAGETGLARTVATRFCDMCAKEPGMYENYDALTGKGLRCPGYSWTAASFMVMANWLNG